MRRDEIHRLLLTQVPELGSLFRMDEVLGFLAMFVWERQLAGDDELVARALDYVESLQRDGPADAAALALRAMFQHIPWSPEVVDRAGPLTSAALVQADWF